MPPLPSRVRNHKQPEVIAYLPQIVMSPGNEALLLRSPVGHGYSL